MSSIAEIEDAIAKLMPQELAKLREWFAAFDAEQWDRQFDSDAKNGRLDKLGDEALSEFRRGQCTDL